MKEKDSLKNISYIGISRLIASSLQAIFYIIFASLLDPQVYGELGYIIALAGTFSVISRFGLNHSVLVYQAKQKVSISNQINILSLITTSVASLVLIPISAFASLLCFSLSIYIMNMHNLLGLKKYKKQLLNAIVRNSSFLILSLFLYFIFDIPGVLLGMAIGNILGSFNFIKSLRIRVESFAGIRNNFRVLINNFGIDTSLHLPRLVDKLLIGPMFGFAFLGLYYLNMQILFALEILPTVVHLFLLSEESSNKSYRKIIYIASLGSVALTIIAIILAPYVITELFPKYVDGIPSLQLIVLSLVPLTISSIFIAKLQAQESTSIGYVGLIRIATLLVLIPILGQLYGLMGLSAAVLISAIVSMIFTLYLYRKSNFSGQLKNKKPFNTL